MRLGRQASSWVPANDSTNDCAASLLRKFLQLLLEVMSPVEGAIRYGNLRKQISDWEDAKGKTTNIALIYETPGGSTNQINVTFRHSPPSFWMLNEVSSTEEELHDLEEAIARIKKHIEAIPEKRRARLQAIIEGWSAKGMKQGEVFSALNRLMYSDLKGAQITQDELAEATRCTIEIFRACEETEV